MCVSVRVYHVNYFSDSEGYSITEGVAGKGGELVVMSGCAVAILIVSVCVCVCTYVNYILTSNKYNISFDYSYIIHL